MKITKQKSEIERLKKNNNLLPSDVLLPPGIIHAQQALKKSIFRNNISEDLDIPSLEIYQFRFDEIMLKDYGVVGSLSRQNLIPEAYIRNISPQHLSELVATTQCLRKLSACRLNSGSF